jgi:type II secretion system protein C
MVAMKQQLWIVNSSLVGIFFVALAISQLLKVVVPSLRIKKVKSEEKVSKKDFSSSMSWEKIYKDDIFGTYIVRPIAPHAKPHFLTPIPEPRSPAVTPPPELPKQEFIAPLGLTVKGIIISSDEIKNVAMIEDESKKEELYHLGEKIKDGQIVKITRDRIVLLRANGQQEVFYLRKDEEKLDPNSPDRWKYIIKKISDTSYEVDPHSLAQEIDTLGVFIDRIAIIGTAYQKGQPTGLCIGELIKNEVGEALGLKQNDIIVSVNGLNMTDVQNRLKVYDDITKLDIDGTISVIIKRDSKEETLTYKLVKINKAKKQLFPSPEQTTQEKKPDEQFKMSRPQEREKLLRDFRDRHQQSNEQKEAIAKIRQRLLENLRNRLQNSRVR